MDALRETHLLYRLGRLKSVDNLCYANASLQCLLSWRPFLSILMNSPNDTNAATVNTCMMMKLKKLFAELKEGINSRVEGDIRPFMQWVFELAGVSLRSGSMEDPHDFMTTIWDKMSLSGGGCLSQCGRACSNSMAHFNIMAWIGLCEKVQYECCNCHVKWDRFINGYSWCPSLSLPDSGGTCVSTLLHKHMVTGVCEVMSSDGVACNCTRFMEFNSSSSVLVRHLLGKSNEGQGKAFALHVNNVYTSNGRRVKYVDRWCEPSLYIEICSSMYMLHGFIVHLSDYGDISADKGHYVAYVRESADGQVTQ